MPVKSVVDIQVNDQEFKEFNELFNKYREALGETGGAWGDVGKEIKGLQSSFEGVAAALMAQAEMVRRGATAQKDQRKEAGLMATAWDNISAKAKSFSSYISSATKNILRWVGIGSLFGGLLGGGGLFGLDRLANLVGGTRRASLGTGTTYGERQAFGVNFGRVVNPEQFLGGVNEALHDITKRYSLYGAGLSEADIKGKGTAEVGEAVLDKWRNIAKGTRPEMMAQVLQARGGSQFFSTEDLQRMAATPDEEWSKYKAGYAKDKGSMNVADKTAAAWQDFSVAMSRAGQKIETVFVNGLAPLIGPITKLTDAFGDLVQKVLASDMLKKWIDVVAEGLKQFADYLTSEKFNRDVRSFIDNVSKMAEKIVSAMRWLGLIPDSKQEEYGPWQPGKQPEAWEDQFGGKRDLYGNPVNDNKPASNDNNPNRKAEDARRDLAIAQFGRGSFEDKLAMIKKLEGSKSWQVSKAGAVGEYQIMPGTAQMYDLNLPQGTGEDARAKVTERLKDPIYNETIARRILKDLDQREKGDFTQELIGYNAGPGRADQFRAAGRDQGMLPAETQRYLQRAAELAARPQRTVVEVRNNTGGNAVIQASQLSQ